MEHFVAGDYLVLQNEVSGLKEMIEAAAVKGLRIVLNPSPFDERLRELDFHKLSWLIVNEIEARQLTGECEQRRVWDKIHTAYPKLNVVMTVGSDGAWCYTSQEEIFPAGLSGKGGRYHCGGGYLYRVFSAGSGCREKFAGMYEAGGCGFGPCRGACGGFRLHSLPG